MLQYTFEQVFQRNCFWILSYPSIYVKHVKNRLATATGECWFSWPHRNARYWTRFEKDTFLKHNGWFVWSAASTTAELWQEEALWYASGFRNWYLWQSDSKLLIRASWQGTEVSSSCAASRLCVFVSIAGDMACSRRPTCYSGAGSSCWQWSWPYVKTFEVESNFRFLTPPSFALAFAQSDTS